MAWQNDQSIQLGALDYFCDSTGPDFMHPTYTLGVVRYLASLFVSIPARTTTTQDPWSHGTYRPSVPKHTCK